MNSPHDEWTKPRIARAPLARLPTPPRPTSTVARPSTCRRGHVCAHHRLRRRHPPSFTRQRDSVPRRRDTQSLAYAVLSPERVHVRSPSSLWTAPALPHPAKRAPLAAGRASARVGGAGRVVRVPAPNTSPPKTIPPHLLKIPLSTLVPIAKRRRRQRLPRPHIAPAPKYARRTRISARTSHESPRSRLLPHQCRSRRGRSRARTVHTDSTACVDSGGARTFACPSWDTNAVRSLDSGYATCTGHDPSRFVWAASVRHLPVPMYLPHELRTPYLRADTPFRSARTYAARIRAHLAA
ncbi:hypothetical protein C8R44DRAFT_753934 [Mycena epipterygia]|nr:hypothetical protein C8R44DRAFT_753934 [Mycena epipterygia]